MFNRIFYWFVAIKWNPDTITAAANVALAFLTLVLAFGSFFLWRATKSLVNGAAKTAEQQLRAYISITPKLIFNWRHKSNIIIIGFDIENHGQTVGSEITYDFSMAILNAPLDNGFVFPDANSQYTQNNSLFPKTIVPVRLFFDRTVTNSEIADIEAGSKRFHVWGTMHYRDAFNEQRTTRFSFSFGGPDFANSMKGVPGAQWYWEHSQHHNDAT